MTHKILKRNRPKAVRRQRNETARNRRQYSLFDAVPLAPQAAFLAATFLVAQQLGDGGFIVYSINEVSLRQTITPDRLLGRVNAAFEICAHGVLLIGILTGGALGETLGLRGTLALASGAMLLAALWLAASPVFRLRAAPGGALEGSPRPPLPETGPVV